MSTMAVDIENGYVTVTVAAEIIGVTVGRVRQLLLSKEMKGQKLSDTVWVIERKEAEKFAKNPHKTGRPRSSRNSA